MKNKEKSNFKMIILLFFLFWVVFLFISKLESQNYFLGIDLRFENLAIAFRFQSAVNFFKVITFLGNWQFIFPLTVIICLAFWRYKKFKYLLPLLLVTAGGQLCNSILKAILQKPRPPFPLVAETSYSFPSGHAIISTAFYGFLIYFVFLSLKSKLLKFLVIFAGVIFIFLIGFSRIYLTVHYYSDVLAGFTLGITWLLLGILWFKNLKLKVNKFIVPAFSVAIILISSLFFLTLPHPKIPTPLKTVITVNALDELKTEDLPKFTEKLSGAYQQPLSFFIIARNDNELINTFAKAGWVLTDMLDPKTILKLAETAIENKPYPQGPVTPSLWDNQVQNFSFAKPTQENTIRQRHHCRIWKTNIKTTGGETFYVGTASYDLGIEPWLITHKIDPNIDKEREFLFNDLLKTGKISNFEKINSVGSIKGTNFQGDYFYTDGKAYLIYFK